MSNSENYRKTLRERGEAEHESPRSEPWYKNISLSKKGEDEVYTGSLGKDVGSAKVVSFVISGMLASIAGVLYAHYVSYIDPTSFTLDESIFILSIVIIGGMRNLWGVFLATAFLVLLPEALRFVGLPLSVAANIRQIVYGVALVIVIFSSKRKYVKEKNMSNNSASLITHGSETKEQPFVQLLS